jgi:hypothetical protein
MRLTPGEVGSRKSLPPEELRVYRIVDRRCCGKQHGSDPPVLPRAKKSSPRRNRRRT